MAPSEADPLLPQGSSAPEISGYGFSRPSKAQYQTRSEVMERTGYIGDKAAGDRSPRSLSPLRILISLFTITVGLAVFITLLLPESLGSPWHGPNGDTSTVPARVDKILKENPLIGPQT